MTKLEEYISDLRTVNAEYANIALECSIKLAAVQKEHVYELERVRTQVQRDCENRMEQAYTQRIQDKELLIGEKDAEIKRLTEITNQVSVKIEKEAQSIQKVLSEVKKVLSAVQKAQEMNKDSLNEALNEAMAEMKAHQDSGLPEELQKQTDEILQQVEQMLSQLLVTEDDAQASDEDEEDQDELEDEAVQDDTDDPDEEDDDEDNDEDEPGTETLTESSELSSQNIADILNEQDSNYLYEVFRDLENPELSLTEITKKMIVKELIGEEFIGSILDAMLERNMLDDKCRKDLRKKLKTSSD